MTFAHAGFIKDGIEAKQNGDHQKLIEIYDNACYKEKKLQAVITLGYCISKELAM